MEKENFFNREKKNRKSVNPNLFANVFNELDMVLSENTKSSSLKKFKSIAYLPPKDIIRMMSENAFAIKKKDEDSIDLSDDGNPPEELQMSHRRVSVRKNPLKKMNTLKEMAEELHKEEKLSPKEIEEQKTEMLQNLIDEYYMEIFQNFPANWEDYVVNNLAIVSYIQHIVPTNIELPEFDEETMKKIKSFDRNKKILFLDLDETLIHSDLDGEYDNFDTVITLKSGGLDAEDSKFNLLIRPYYKEFLEYAKEKFNVVLFTAGLKEYAESIVRYIDPENKYFHLKLYRDSCYNFNNIFIKVLTIINTFDLKEVIIVDNCIFSFCLHLENGILVSSFYNDKEDKELLKVIDYLEENLVNSPDVRLKNEELYGFTKIKEFLFEKLKNEGVIKL